ncbi:polysaccharide biosynthesis protein [Paractinoplanes maris]|uniref:polysaccharide biosynthesis protein n=1 Tax=Paractinoplanes maris TaxID=1734446 RepID=UPI0020209303|nr:polysaccharide biosynthesis protein [Actinoplanes maris]
MQVTDLLGRHRVVVDHAAIGGLLTGRRVLVTCTGGEIGSELCRQIQRYDPAELMMLDHDEAARSEVVSELGRFSGERRPSFRSRRRRSGACPAGFRVSFPWR